jgi:type VI secretion system protein VasG
LRPDLLNYFKPAFLGRCNVVTFYPLADEVLRLIVGLQLKRIAKRLHEHYGVDLKIDDTVTDSIVSRCREVESGARNIENILNRTLLPELSSRILGRLADGIEIGHVGISAEEDGSFRYQVA